jgi:hypothetical protein
MYRSIFAVILVSSAVMLASSSWRVSETDVADYCTGVETLVEKAMTPADSAELIAEVIKRLEKQ